MSKVKPIPDGVPVVMPMLVCRDAAAGIDFCKAVFGAVELVRRPGPDGIVAHALITIGPAMVMIEAEWPTLSSRPPQPDGSSPVVIYVYVLLRAFRGIPRSAAARGLCERDRTLSRSGPPPQGHEAFRRDFSPARSVLARLLRLVLHRCACTPRQARARRALLTRLK
jgi:uncharacterized glyoxalase superfamily protein PhnB